MTVDRGGPSMVSVVMIFRDAQTFMDEAIRSVLAQTYPAVELLLCDDGSRDASTALAHSWVQRHPEQVRYVEHEGHAHRGMSATRNLGTAAAQGDLIAFLDADDVWQPTHLAGQVSALEMHPQATMVCGRALDWRSWDGGDRHDVWSSIPWSSGTVVSPPDMLTAVLRDGGYSTPVCSLLVRRDVIQALGGSEASFTSMYEDQVLLAKLYLTQHLVLSDADTALYRQHDGSSTARAIRRGSYHPMAANRSRQAFLRWLQDQPQLHGDQVDPELAAAVHAALLPYQHRFNRLRWQTATVARAARATLAAGTPRLHLKGRR